MPSFAIFTTFALGRTGLSRMTSVGEDPDFLDSTTHSTLDRVSFKECLNKCSVALTGAHSAHLSSHRSHPHQPHLKTPESAKFGICGLLQLVVGCVCGWWVAGWLHPNISLKAGGGVGRITARMGITGPGLAHHLTTWTHLAFLW